MKASQEKNIKPRDQNSPPKNFNNKTPAEGISLEIDSNNSVRDT